MKHVELLTSLVLPSCLLICAAILPACASEPAASGDGDGDTGDGDGDGDASNELPADSTQAAIEAFLEGEMYKQAPWVGDAATRAGESTVNVHGDALRVYFNPTGLTARQEDAGSSPVGSMAVKEFYDEAGAVVGRAASIKTGEGNTMDDWTFYCSAPGTSLCTGESDPGTLYGAGISECGFCHGQVFYAAPPQ